MKEHDFVAVKTQRFNRSYDVLRRIVKIGDEDDDSAAAQELLKMMQRLGEIGAGMRLRLFEAAQQAMQLPLPGGRPNVRANFIVKDDQARRVALILNCEI